MNAVVESQSIALVEETKESAMPALHQAPQASTSRQLSVVEYAIQSGAPVAEVRALVELQIQMDNHKLAMRRQDDEREKELRAEAARNAYNEAMAAFKAEGVRVIRSKAITDGPLKGKRHADLFAVTDAATEVMSKHGLSATWRPISDEKDWIKVACIVKHVAGHFESVEFGGPIDTGPGRNAIQARKSTVSYLERITLLLALGLAESDADDDGVGAGAPDQNKELQQWVASARSCTTEKQLDGVVRGGVAAFARDKRSYREFGAAVAAHRVTLQQGTKQ